MRGIPLVLLALSLAACGGPKYDRASEVYQLGADGVVNRWTHAVAFYPATKPEADARALKELAALTPTPEAKPYADAIRALLEASAANAPPAKLDALRNEAEAERERLHNAIGMRQSEGAK